MRPLIVIEGVDGVGKSTMAQILGYSLGAVNCVTPPPIVEEFKHAEGFSLREYIDLHTVRKTPVARFFWYLTWLLLTSERIKRERLYSPVVCDRYVASTFAYHKVLLGEIPLPIKRILSVIEQPSLQFLLIASDWEEIKKRLARRKRTTDKVLEENLEFLKRVQQEFLELAKLLNFVVLDTTQLSEEEVLGKMLLEVGKRWKF